MDIGGFVRVGSNTIWRYCDNRKCNYRGFTRKNRKYCPECGSCLLELPSKESQLEKLGKPWVKLLREAVEISTQNKAARIESRKGKREK